MLVVVRYALYHPRADNETGAMAHGEATTKIRRVADDQGLMLYHEV